MAKIYSVVPLELRPGVDGEEFVKFWNGQFAQFGERLGWKGYVLKSDRGDRKGQYAVIWEIPDVEGRDRYVPSPDHITEEALRLLGPDWDKCNEILDTYVTGWPFTDYIVQE
jgi:hypothetical protein